MKRYGVAHYMVEAEKTKIELSEEEIKLFILFQKHFLFIAKFLAEVERQNMKEGYLTMHFTKFGEIGAFDLQEKFSHHTIQI